MIAGDQIRYACPRLSLNHFLASPPPPFSHANVWTSAEVGGGEEEEDNVDRFLFTFYRCISPTSIIRNVGRANEFEEAAAAAQQSSRPQNEVIETTRGYKASWRQRVFWGLITQQTDHARILGRWGSMLVIPLVLLWLPVRGAPEQPHSYLSWWMIMWWSRKDFSSNLSFFWRYLQKEHKKVGGTKI